MSRLMPCSTTPTSSTTTSNSSQTKPKLFDNQHPNLTTMNSNKQDKSKSLRAPFKKLYDKLSSKSSSLVADERSEGNSSADLSRVRSAPSRLYVRRYSDRNLQDAGLVATPVPMVPSASFSSSIRTTVEEVRVSHSLLLLKTDRWHSPRTRKTLETWL